MLSSKPCSVVTSFFIDGFTYLMMDQYKTLVEAIFLKWPHVVKDINQEMRILCMEVALTHKFHKN